jgi:zinc and cadmium transporter
MTLALVVLSCAIVAVSVLGGWLPLGRSLTHTRMQVYLSFAAGAMIGATFFHMLPEALEVAPGSLPWAAFGLLALFLLERFFSFHQHEPADGHDHHTHEHSATPGKALHWRAAAIGLAVHTIAGGVALASAVSADRATHGVLGPATWGVFVATLIHKPADALTVVTLMLRAGVAPARAHLVNFGFALMIPLGVVCFVLGMGGLDAHRVETMSGVALAFSGGTFLCIALSDLLPELQFHSHDRIKLTVSLFAGVALMYVTS